MQNSVILSTAYLAPIQYYSKLLKYDNSIVELHENYVKQSFRNRCNIYGANGLQTLSIPIKKDISPKILIKDIKISYEKNWQKNHWKAIKSAYGSSPFYEYFVDDFVKFYKKKFNFLIDFNREIQQVVLNLLEIDTSLTYTNSYNKNCDIKDFREIINPKKRLSKPDDEFTMVEYYQVFAEKHGFIPNLSIIDLLFNEGTNAYDILNKSTI
ncbi:MAG: WbqC family protein [Bacteroidetes bacterium]|nr:WbqC family protein [Bacteroidota bacterium]